MIESKCERSPWWLLLLAFFAIMATGIDSSACSRKNRNRSRGLVENLVIQPGGTDYDTGIC